jgi:hypothetical protein
MSHAILNFEVNILNIKKKLLQIQKPAFKY